LQTGALSVSNPSCPIVPYAIAKDALRTFLSNLQEEHAYKFKWLRLFYMYGDGQNKSSLLEQLKCALNNHESEFKMSGGEQLRDYLPVEMVAKDIVQLSTKIEDSGTYNVCSGVPISVKSFVDKYLQETGQSIQLNLGFYPYPDYEPMNFWGVKNY
jgi:dTDP-6-deoxy-L-talose 4-dehydrogenase (NAD+)